MGLIFLAIFSGSGAAAWLEMISPAFLRARCRAFGFPFSSQASQSEFKVGNHPTRRVVPGCTGYTTAGVAAGATQIQSLYGCAILGGPWMWAQRKKLVHIVAPVEDIRFRESVYRFQVQGAQHPAADDEFGQVGHDPCNIGYDPIGNIFFDVIPAYPVGQLIRIVLGQYAHDMPPRGR